MTPDHIYTFKGSAEERSRYYKIKDVGAIITSLENEKDLMLFFERSDDLHISCTDRQTLLDLLKLRFASINRNITLRVYGVTNA